MVALNYQVMYPDEFDDFEWADIEAKGWLDDVRIVREDEVFTMSVFDEIRLLQAIDVDVKRQGFFVANRLLVVPSVTRENIELAVSRMSEHSFPDF